MPSVDTNEHRHLRALWRRRNVRGIKLARGNPLMGMHLSLVELVIQAGEAVVLRDTVAPDKGPIDKTMHASSILSLVLLGSKGIIKGPSSGLLSAKGMRAISGVVKCGDSEDITNTYSLFAFF
ncbi:hypothetical protein V6N11_025559 [Hibiscus sabdariffa]|uniref:Uncharacterized protein n=1 Tax=Hibiscus sabdariffa TaxID=183260 RepID=A0ABR2N8G9_9ROSI